MGIDQLALGSPPYPASHCSLCGLRPCLELEQAGSRIPIASFARFQLKFLPYLLPRHLLRDLETHHQRVKLQPLRPQPASHRFVLNLPFPSGLGMESRGFRRRLSRPLVHFPSPFRYYGCQFDSRFLLWSGYLLLTAHSASSPADGRAMSLGL